MSAPIIAEAAKVFADPPSYADEPRVRAALTHLRAHAPVSRLKTIELGGNPELISTTFVGGLKHLPIRYQVR
jgi:hypothetical protein